MAAGFSTLIVSVKSTKRFVAGSKKTGIAPILSIFTSPETSFPFHVLPAG